MPSIPQHQKLILSLLSLVKRLQRRVCLSFGRSVRPSVSGNTFWMTWKWPWHWSQPLPTACPPHGCPCSFLYFFGFSWSISRCSNQSILTSKPKSKQFEQNILINSIIINQSFPTCIISAVFIRGQWWQWCWQWKLGATLLLFLLHLLFWLIISQCHFYRQRQQQYKHK